MKCFLLLAAVYALIFNQWQKEQSKATASEAARIPVKTVAKKSIDAEGLPVTAMGGVLFATYFRTIKAD